MTFKELLIADIDNVFLNFEEYGEEHIIDGKQVICVFDEDKLTERQGSNELAVSDSSILLFAKQDDLPRRKVNGDKLVIDGKVYEVDDWKVNFGMAEVVLSHGESR